MEDYFNIGIIVNTHGIRGEVKIKPTTDEPKRFELLKSVMVDLNNTIKSYTLKHIKYHKQLIIAQFNELTTMNDAEGLKGGIIKIPRSSALPLEDNEFYVSDLIGLKVKTVEQEVLGKISDVIFTGGNDVYVVKSEGKKDLLIPAIKECVKTIDLTQKIMLVEVMKGLLDL